MPAVVFKMVILSLRLILRLKENSKDGVELIS